ncbi:hypothetical protein JCM11491_002818 [Sporobolomyces phaffii]
MVPVVGNWFNAQQVFNAASSQTVGEYCAKAQSDCLAVCPNAPITGPGTLIVMTLGTFVNLLFVLWYQSEAPYNLAYQIVATDGAAFGLLNRLVQPNFRLSQFHAAFVPLAIMSCMPLALAACLNDVPSYHSHPLIVKDSRPAKVLELIDQVEIPRKYLITAAWSFFTIHLLVVWPVLLTWVYFFNRDFNQPHCADVFPLERFHNVLAVLSFSWIGFALVLWLGFTFVLYFSKQKKYDLLERIGLVLHLTSKPDAADGHRELIPWFNSRADGPASKVDFGFFKARKRSITRWILSIATYWVWAAQYMSIYFSALHGFVLIGTNGFDYGQVVAVVSIMVPAFLIMRAQLDYTFYWSHKRAIDWTPVVPGPRTTGRRPSSTSHGGGPVGGSSSEDDGLVEYVDRDPESRGRSRARHRSDSTNRALDDARHRNMRTTAGVIQNGLTNTSLRSPSQRRDGRGTRDV